LTRILKEHSNAELYTRLYRILAVSVQFGVLVSVFFASMSDYAVLFGVLLLWNCCITLLWISFKRDSMVTLLWFFLPFASALFIGAWSPYGLFSAEFVGGAFLFLYALQLMRHVAMMLCSLVLRACWCRYPNFFAHKSPRYNKLLETISFVFLYYHCHAAFALAVVTVQFIVQLALMIVLKLVRWLAFLFFHRNSVAGASSSL
jgi:hypothetical protein